MRVSLSDIIIMNFVAIVLNVKSQIIKRDRFQTLITTTHINSFDAQWLKASQILSVEAGKINLVK